MKTSKTPIRTPWEEIQILRKGIANMIARMKYLEKLEKNKRYKR